LSAGPPCPFCDPAGHEVVAENQLAFAFLDGYPLNPGHILVVPRRHVPTWSEATRDEKLAILDLADQVMARLDVQGVAVPGPDAGPHSDKSATWDAAPGTHLVPDGYNLGVNVGRAAGQTVMHAHLHVIPRYRGDHPDPRGGVRWIFPKKARYWEE
jgi:diadenosine tetraphosphate (Ap4A) HIT family hydrolase